MTRFMIDSITGSEFESRGVNIPGVGYRVAALTAGYANGSYHASSQDPSPSDVTIDVDGSLPGADVLDIEYGDAFPGQAADWVFAHNAHPGTNFPAILYTSRSNIPVVASVCESKGLIAGRDFWWWISTMDSTQTLPDMTGVLAVQAWNADSFPGRNIDVSIVHHDGWKPSTKNAEDIMYSFTLPAAPNGSRYALALPVSRQCTVTLACDGEAVLTEYGWAEAGGNGFSETNVSIHDKGSHSFSPPLGTGKVDLQYTSENDVNGVVDIVS